MLFATSLLLFLGELRFRFSVFIFTFNLTATSISVIKPTPALSPPSSPDFSSAQKKGSIDLHETVHMGMRRAVAATQTTKTSRKRSPQNDASSPPLKRVKTAAAIAASPQVKKGGQGAKVSTQTPFLNTAPTARLEVFVFGDGSAGELGLGNKDAIEVQRPRLNHILDPNSVGVVSLAAGGMHAVALTHNNKILTWGVNDLNALGRDTIWEGELRDINGEKDSDSGESEPDLNPRESNPTPISADRFPAGTRFVQVAAGDSATFSLTDEGLVYGWGTFRVSLASIIIHILKLTVSDRIVAASLVSTSSLITNSSNFNASLCLSQTSRESSNSALGTTSVSRLTKKELCFPGAVASRVNLGAVLSSVVA